MAEITQSNQNTTQASPLQVDFSWRKFHALVSEGDEPLYIADFKIGMRMHIDFKSGVDDTIIGTGHLHNISIDADYEIRGRKGTLKALKRFKTEYTHLSEAYADGDAPMTMTWSSDYSLKKWNFVCVDEQQLPVARFSSNIWATKKLGNIEFLGPKASSPAVREEIVITAITLWFCMAQRHNSIFNLFGAVFSRPGPLKNESPTEGQLTGKIENDRGDKDGISNSKQTAASSQKAEVIH